MKRFIPVVVAAVIFSFRAESSDIWRGLVIVPEDRCSDYASDDYSYPQSVEPKEAAMLCHCYHIATYVAEART